MLHFGGALRSYEMSRYIKVMSIMVYKSYRDKLTHLHMDDSIQIIIKMVIIIKTP